MLIDDCRTRELLARIIYRLSADQAVREDLMQEALVHLWLMEEQRPGQTQSWYLQGCKFHLQNYLGAGRSVDSPKRNGNRVKFMEGEEETDVVGFDSSFDDEVFDQISARDLFSQLRGKLMPFEQEILNRLSEGFGAREIAIQLNVTHPTVIKYRRRIATMAMSLGVLRLPAYQRKTSSSLALAE